MTIFIVGDVPSSASVRAMVASNSQQTGINTFYFYSASLAFSVFARVTNSTGKTFTANVPHIFVGQLDPVGGTIDGSVDGGAWGTASVGASAVNFDTTMQIGAYRTDTANLFVGSIADVLTFTDPLKDTADLAVVISTMKAKYGIA